MTGLNRYRECTNARIDSETIPTFDTTGGKRPDMSRIRMRYLFMLVPLLMLRASPVLAQSPGNQATRTLTLEGALQLAGEQNPTLNAAQQQVISAEGAVLGAWGRMLPTVDLNHLWNFSEKVQEIFNPFPVPGGPEKLKIDFTQDFQGSINVGMPVMMWGVTRNGWQDARTARDMATSSLESSRRDVIMQVTQAFYGVLLAEEGLQVARDALAQAERQEAVAAEKLAQGAASEFDLLRARVQVANLRPPVTRTEAMVRQVRIGLNLLLGLPADEQVQLEGDLEYSPVELNLDELKQMALANRADLHSARLGVQRAELAVSMATKTRLPALVLSGMYSFRADDAMLNERFNDNYMANLVVTFPIFDGLAAKSRRTMAMAGREQARIMVNQLQQVVEAEVEQAFNDLRAAEQTYLAQMDNVEVAERALEIAQVSYENEMMTSVELMDSQLALTMARQNHFQSLYDYVVALARIEKAVGQPISF